MKITIIGPVYPYRGGIAHFTTALCRELTDSGHLVQAVSFRRQYPAWLYPGQSDRDPSLMHDQVPAQYALDPLYVWTWFQTVGKIAAFQPQLVIIMWWTSFWAPAFYTLSAALRRRGIPCVFCIHNVIPHENRLPDRWLARRVLSLGKAFITLSPKETERLKNLLPSANVYQSQLPVPKNLQAPIDRQAARAELGISGDQPALLFFGIVRPYKGLAVLLDALAQLAEQGFRPFLMVVGEFWDDIQKYRQQIERLSLAEQILLENRYVPNEELPKYFSAADAFVAPYIQGTQSAAIKMAMGYRLPILASDQISRDLPVGDYPILVHTAGDSADLMDKIRLLIQNSRGEIGTSPQTDDWRSLVSVVEQVKVQVTGTPERERVAGNQPAER